MDALSLGGFVFTERNAEDSHNSKDADGIAFHQRRDQLNRRLRQAQVRSPHFGIAFAGVIRTLNLHLYYSIAYSCSPSHFSRNMQGFIKSARLGSQKYEFEDSC